MIDNFDGHVDVDDEDDNIDDNEDDDEDEDGEDDSSIDDDTVRDCIAFVCRVINPLSFCSLHHFRIVLNDNHLRIHLFEHDRHVLAHLRLRLFGWSAIAAIDDLCLRTIRSI